MVNIKENEDEWQIKYQKTFEQYNDALQNINLDQDKFTEVLYQMEQDFKFYE